MITYEVVAEFEDKYKNEWRIDRDNYGKFYIYFNKARTQSKLNASEIVRYLANALEGK